MASWRPNHSVILSLLLDTVVGTKENIEIRKDYCRLGDCFQSIANDDKVYFTGSKAEGLDLPGSDEDYMMEINNWCHIKVTQTFNKNNDTSPDSNFFMSTRKLFPCFALLQHIPRTPIHFFLYRLSKNINGLRHLSSEFYMQNKLLETRKIPKCHTVKRQGPSTEAWSIFSDKSKSGIDFVSSIHCAFWPDEATEWVQRSRQFAWPTSQDISSITNFGFHLVPVGHPHSEMKQLEWRVSFSVAERTLVWSFNHVQMQCYAVMKIILKEFIKVRCNPQNQVLCSYFVKTFLFWKYETTELNFWREDNLRECIKYLITEFSKCIQEGVLKHYFIPRFNLLFVKLKQEAQTELLQLFDIIIQNDISILRECRTLRDIWSEFIQVCENRNYDNVISKRRKLNLLRIDSCVVKYMYKLRLIRKNLCTSMSNTINQVLALSCKSPLKILVLKQYLFEEHFSLLIHTCVPGNKGVYQLCKTAQNDPCSFDISTSKLWCAILFFKNRDFSSTLNIINRLLLSIPPFDMILYNPAGGKFVDKEAKQLYVDIFLHSDVTMIQRAKKAWMLDLCVTKNMTDLMPLAIQIELHFISDGLPVYLSPFISAYYLQFLCYHRMHQYDNRDRVLQQLIEVVKNIEQCGWPHTSLNIVGHCLLLAGNTLKAHDMFHMSYFTTIIKPPIHKYNSALWYLLNCF